MNKKILISVLCLIVGVFLTAAPSLAQPQCPPDEKAVQEFCSKNYPEKTDECVKGIMSGTCDADLAAAVKTPVGKSTAVDLQQCMKFGGGFFGCAFWLAVGR